MAAMSGAVCLLLGPPGSVKVATEPDNAQNAGVEASRV
jgi:hypothetical protein